MRPFLIILLFCSIALVASRFVLYVPANYYFSATGNDATGNGTIGNPWQTITKLNLIFSSLGPGDSILLKRGDTFTGGIVPSVSGSSGNPIVVGSYGTGAKPIITGFQTVSGWTSVGGGIYEASLNTGLRLNMLTIDGVQKYVCRWPNADAANYGFLSVNSSTFPGYPTNATITSTGLAGATGLVGSELVNIANFYTINSREPVVAFNSGTNTITYTPKSGAQSNPDFGFFFQGSPSFMDQANEWYYNSTAHTIQIVGNPAGKLVKASTVSDLVSVSSKNYLTFDNLTLSGADSSFFRLDGTYSNITIQNCDMQFAGSEAITSSDATSSGSNLLIQNNNITDVNSYGILMYNTSNCSFLHNTLRRSSLYVGAGRWGTAGYGGVYIEGPDTRIIGNTVDSVGGGGIGSTGGNNITIDSNHVSNFGLVEKDIGGIYFNALGFTGCKIRSNIVHDGIGNSFGTPESPITNGANLIYLDEGGGHVLVENNTVFRTPSYGIYMHQSSYDTIRSNTIFAGISQYHDLSGGISSRDDQSSSPNGGNTNIRIVNNIIYQPTINTNSKPIHLFSTHQDIQTNFLDSNLIIRPFSSYGNIANEIQSTSLRFYDQPGVYGKYGWEQHGTTIWPMPHYSATLTTGSNLFPNGTFASTSLGSTVYSNDGLTVSVESKLDGNSLKVTGTVDSNQEKTIEYHFGAVTAGIYRLRFSMIGSSTRENIRSRWYASGYFGEYGFFAPRTTRTENELFVNVTSSNSDLILVVFIHDNLPIWFDNIEMFKTNASTTSIDVTDSVKFEYNATFSPVVKNLGGNFRDARGVPYTTSITLAPFTSAVLHRENNASPVANGGFDPVITAPTTGTSLDGSGSTDAEGSILSFQWFQISGPNTGTFSAATSSITNYTGLIPGTYLVQLRVTDNAGFVGYDTLTVTVNGAANMAPTSNAGSDKFINLPTSSTTLNGSGTDSDGTIAGYSWTQISGPTTATFSSASVSVPTVSSLFAGNYVFQLITTDDDGATSSGDFVTVFVNARPIANAGADKAIMLPTTSVALTGSAIDADGSVATYAWTQTTGPNTAVISNATIAAPTVSGLIAGTYTFSLTVTDNLGGVSTADLVSVVVSPHVNAAPTANAGADITLTVPVSTTTLSGSGIDTDGTIASYAWAKVSGPAYAINNAAIASPTLSLLTAGVYVFRLTVVDNNGASATDDVIITVSATSTNSFKVNGRAEFKDLPQ